MCVCVCVNVCMGVCSCLTLNVCEFMCVCIHMHVCKCGRGRVSLLACFKIEKLPKKFFLVVLFGRRENHRAQQQQHSAWNGREHFCLFFLSLGENFFQEMEYETFLQPQKQKFEADSKI